MVLVGCIHAIHAIVRPINSTVIVSTLVAIMISIAMPGTVINESDVILIKVSVNPPM